MCTEKAQCIRVCKLSITFTYSYNPSIIKVQLGLKKSEKDMIKSNEHFYDTWIIGK